MYFSMTAASSTTQKINLNSCSHEQVFQALACIDARLATATVKDNGPNKIAHPVRHVSDISVITFRQHAILFS